MTVSSNKRFDSCNFCADCCTNNKLSVSVLKNFDHIFADIIARHQFCLERHVEIAANDIDTQVRRILLNRVAEGSLKVSTVKKYSRL